MNKSYMFNVVPRLSNKVVEVVPSMPSMGPAGSYTCTVISSIIEEIVRVSNSSIVKLAVAKLMISVRTRHEPRLAMISPWKKPFGATSSVIKSFFILE